MARTKQTARKYNLTVDLAVACGRVVSPPATGNTTRL